ncbi:MAG: hypothetical protein AAGU32_16595, partial [Bacillota bacterium]
TVMIHHTEKGTCINSWKPRLAMYQVEQSSAAIEVRSTKTVTGLTLFKAIFPNSGAMPKHTIPMKA